MAALLFIKFSFSSANFIIEQHWIIIKLHCLNEMHLYLCTCFLLLQIWCSEVFLTGNIGFFLGGQVCYSFLRLRRLLVSPYSPALNAYPIKHFSLLDYSILLEDFRFISDNFVWHSKAKQEKH